MRTICICGGGSLGHTIAGYIAAQGSFSVSVLTSRPKQWNKELQILTPDNELLIGKLTQVSDNAALLIPKAEIILICVPGYGVVDVLQQIKPYLTEMHYLGSVVSSTGFFFQALELLPHNISLFGFQRVPFIARTIEYGQKAKIKGYKKELLIAVENAADNKKEFLKSFVQKIFKVPVKLLNSHYEASLTNSNPLLHTSRLYSMWNEWKPGVRYVSCPLFYADWTVEAAQYYIDMDKEFQTLLDSLHIIKGTIPTVLQYYESYDAISLCNKLKSIPAFQEIYSPMIGDSICGFEPDFDSRYFTEDFPYSLGYIVRLAHKLSVPIPLIDKVYDWGMAMIKKYSNLKD